MLALVEHHGSYEILDEGLTTFRYRGTCTCGWQAKLKDCYPGHAQQRGTEHAKSKNTPSGG